MRVIISRRALQFFLSNKIFPNLAAVQNNPEEDEDNFGFGWFDEPETETEVSTKPKGCTGNGIFHVGPCKFGAPLATSWPHFLDTDPPIETVTGLKADKSKHQFYMDFQPEMGIGIRAYVRMQFNLNMERSKAFPQLASLPIESSESLLVPIMWFEDVIEAPPENLQILLKDALQTGPTLANNSAMFAFIGLCLQIIFYLCFCMWTYHKSDPEK